MKLFTKRTGIWLAAIAAVEIISLIGNFWPTAKTIGAILVLLATAIIAFKNLEGGLLVMFVELIIGSKGHLLELGPLSIRIVIFAVIMAAFLGHLCRREQRAIWLEKFRQFHFSRYFLILAAFVIWALVTAFWQHNAFSNIFADINAWFFFLLLLPVVAVYYRADKKVYERLAQVITAAFLWLGLETLLLLFIFTHNLPIASAVYHWLRTTGVAEITVTVGAWPRIFLQSQIYAALALVILPWLTGVKDKKAWILMIIAWSVCLLSMSRSFWLATAAVLLLEGLILLIKGGWKKLWPPVALVIGSALGAALLITIITVIPISSGNTNFSADSFLERASLDSGEAAVASRWSLLPALWHKITVHPIIGSGFGATVTYKSSDPRILQNNPSGEYTTYAFEWGYLAFWLKLGILGLAAYLWLLFVLIRRGWQEENRGHHLAGALALGIIVLVITHFFTPYLDYPLGIGYLVLAAALLDTPEKPKEADLPER